MIGRSKSTCMVKGCCNVISSRGMCTKHYQQARRGKIQFGPSRTERVLLFVESCLNAETDECLEPPFKFRSEYPSFLCNGVNQRIGWLVLERSKGPRPRSTCVMRHVVCGNPRCCNPRHLEWGTEKENMADKKRHGTEYDKRGENNPNAKLTLKQVLYLRRHYRKGRGPYDTGNIVRLAKNLGVSVGLARGAINRGWTL